MGPVLSRQPDTPAPGISRRAGRLASVDLLRGLVMVLMALDHTREYFGSAANPTDPATTTVALFFTRWVTHFCAPVFFLLTGTGAALARRNRSTADLSRFLFVRGVWLIVLEFVAVRWVMQFNVDYRVTVVTVFWAIGWSMIALAILVHLPASAVAAAGIAMIAVHNRFDAVRPAAFGSWAPLWAALHGPGVILATSRHLVIAAYPLIPWMGVTAAGFGLGQVYGWPADSRRRFLLRTGGALTAAFVALRAANVYGDPSRWSHQRSAVMTALSFLNTTKYPPSLLFLLMTLGPALCVLAACDGRFPRLLRPAVVFGQVPLFYFLAHLFAIHLAAVLVCFARYRDAHWMVASPRPDQFPFTRPAGWGFDLPIVYLIWIGIVVGMYPLCRWFAGVKRRQSSAWLSYV